MAAMWQVAEGYFLDSQSSAYCLVHLVVTEGIWYGWRSERRKRTRQLTSQLTSHIVAEVGSPMAKWQLQDAKAKFSKVVDDAVAKGPQIVTKRGVDTAVVVSMADWRESQRNAHADLERGAAWGRSAIEIPIPKRGQGKWRKAPVFD